MRRFVAAGFGVGWIPSRLWGSHSGAGTFGAALAALLAWPLIPAPGWVDVAVAATAIGASLWAAAPQAEGHADPGWVVIDEMAGTFVAAVGLAGWPWVVAVVVARLADIFKVLPGVARAELIEGSLGITADDVLAGLYGLAAGWILTMVS